MGKFPIALIQQHKPNIGHCHEANTLHLEGGFSQRGVFVYSMPSVCFL
jgi:hypothetical protein